MIASLMSALIGWIAVRTEGIYTIMITLAVATACFYFAQQNYALFNGFPGYNGLRAPDAFGAYWRDPVPFYYLCLANAVVAYIAVLYGARSTFGLTLQAIRDKPAPHACHRLQCDRPQGLRLVAGGPDRRCCGHPARLVQWADFAGHDCGRAGNQHSGHRHHRRAAPSDRAVSRRGHRHPDADLCDRYHRCGAVQHAHRSRVSADCLHIAGWNSRSVGAGQAASGPGRLAVVQKAANKAEKKGRNA